MFVPEEYQDYIYLVDCSDNYFILSTSHRIYGSSGDPDTIPVVYQYINPSIYTVETTYSSEETTTFNDISSSFSDSIFDRGDFLPIFICNFLTCVIFIWIINQLSRLFYKGGAFGSQ